MAAALMLADTHQRRDRIVTSVRAAAAWSRRTEADVDLRDLLAEVSRMAGVLTGALPVTEATKRVEESIWRCITVPGSTELALARRLRAVGATVTE